MTYKDESIVLRSYDCKEYDRLYEVFSNNFGKKVVVAKGVRKPKAKLAGGLEPITASEIFLAHGRGFDKVTGVIIKDQFPGIKNDFTKINEAKKFFNNIKKIFADKSLESEVNEKAYDLIYFYLQFLEKRSFVELDNLKIKLSVYWKIINWLGYQPGIFKCFNCGKKIEELNFYSFFVPYGVSCGACLNIEKKDFFQEIKIDKNSLKILRLFLASSQEKVVKVSMPFGSIKKVEKVVKSTLEQIPEKRLDI
ncbi:MAG: DNA repair protein RecO [Candidatus Moraniibacteriota bacterium]